MFNQNNNKPAIITDLDAIKRDYKDDPDGLHIIDTTREDIIFTLKNVHDLDKSFHPLKIFAWAHSVSVDEYEYQFTRLMEKDFEGLIKHSATGHQHPMKVLDQRFLPIGLLYQSPMHIATIDEYTSCNDHLAKEIIPSFWRQNLMSLMFEIREKILGTFPKDISSNVLNVNFLRKKGYKPVAKYNNLSITKRIPSVKKIDETILKKLKQINKLLAKKDPSSIISPTIIAKVKELSVLETSFILEKQQSE